MPYNKADIDIRMTINIYRCGYSYRYEYGYRGGYRYPYWFRFSGEPHPTCLQSPVATPLCEMTLGGKKCCYLSFWISQYCRIRFYFVFVL